MIKLLQLNTPHEELVFLIGTRSRYELPCVVLRKDIHRVLDLECVIITDVVEICAFRGDDPSIRTLELETTGSGLGEVPFDDYGISVLVRHVCGDPVVLYLDNYGSRPRNISEETGEE